MDFLKEIIAQKSRRLAQAKEICSEERMRMLAHDARSRSEPHLLRRALESRDRLNVIAEIKRASPSKGVLRAGLDPASITKGYESAGAAGISVLTEEDRFKGSIEDLKAVSGAVQIPVLRKDFIFDEFQLYEAAEAGADALLLIVAALDNTKLSALRSITEDKLGMDALVEVHSAEELHRACDCGATLIGVNNRDLRTFEVSLETSIRVSREMPKNVLSISESGLNSAGDLRLLRELGFDGFLIGEAFMRAKDPGRTLREIIEDGFR
jgi:indole-3-glycerol phosphate synthase